MSKKPQADRAAASDVGRGHSTATGRPLFLTSSARTASASTSVGLSLAGLPSTPSPLLIGPRSDNSLGYFGMQPRVSQSSQSQAAQARPVGATATGQFVTRTHRSSSSSTKSGASDLLAALNDSKDDGEGSHTQPSSVPPTAMSMPSSQTPGVRFMDGAIHPPSRGSVDTFTSRGSVSSFADDASSTHASPGSPRSSTPDSHTRQRPPRSKLPVPRLQQSNVKRSHAGHGMGFVPAPAAPSLASPSSSLSKSSGESMPRSQSTSERLVDVLGSHSDPPSILRNSKGRSDTSVGPSQASSIPRYLVPKKADTGDKDISAPVAAGAGAGSDRQTKIRLSREGSSPHPKHTNIISSTSHTMSSAASEASDHIIKTELFAERARRSATPSPPPRSGDSRGSGKYCTPSSSIDGDVFYTPTQSRAPTLPGSSAAPARPRNRNLKDHKSWVPIGASDSEENMQLNDVEENASGSSSSSTTAATQSSTDTDGQVGEQLPGKTFDDAVNEGDRYVPPYETRKRHNGAVSPAAKTLATAPIRSSTSTAALSSDKKFSVTLIASLGRQSADGMPFGRRRVELELTWDAVPDSSLWSLVPGSSYIPGWRLTAAGGTSGYEQVGFARRTVGKLPVIGGVAAAWL